MHGSAAAGDVPGPSSRWEQVDAWPAGEAHAFAATVAFTRTAERAYTTAYAVTVETAHAEMRLLLERFLRTGRLAREHGDGSILRVRSHVSDGEVFYGFLADTRNPCIVKFSGPDDYWFGRVHLPTDDLVARIEENRRTAAEAQERVVADAQARRALARAQQEEATAWRREQQGDFPLFEFGQYDREGNAVPPPEPLRPITDEAKIRRVGRMSHVLFHADALNSPFFRELPPQERFEALARVVDYLLRAPTKGTVVVRKDGIEVSGRQVRLTFTPDCVMVRRLNPPSRTAMPARYRADRFKSAPPRTSRGSAQGEVSE